MLRVKSSSHSCSAEVEKNFEPLGAERNFPAAGKLKLSFPWPGLAGPADSLETFWRMDLTMSGLSLILEVSSQRGLRKRRS